MHSLYDLMKEKMIAQIDLELLSAQKGKKERIQLIVESPICESENQWSCSVTDPQNNEKTKVYGNDSMQCLALGINYIGARMNTMKKEGFTWTYADTDDDFPIAAYFPSSETQIQSR